MDGGSGGILLENIKILRFLEGKRLKYLKKIINYLNL
jgi:hypothetical protein